MNTLKRTIWCLDVNFNKTNLDKSNLDRVDIKKHSFFLMKVTKTELYVLIGNTI